MLAAFLLRPCCIPFLPYHSCLGAKGDLLSIAPQGLLLDLGPRTSWPCPRHATWHTSGG